MQTPDPQFIALIRGHLKYLKASEEFNADKELKAMGLDSMAAIDLLLDIEDTYGITLPDRFLTEETFSTTRALWSVIAELREEAGLKGQTPTCQA